MGNCFKSQTGDDISLLNDSASYAGAGAAAEGAQDSEPAPGLLLMLPPPPSPLYQVEHSRSRLLSALLKTFTTSNNLEQVQIPVYHPTPSQTRLATQLTEEEQIRIAQRLGLIQHLPKGSFDFGKDSQNKKIKECVICMMDFVYGDPIRFLPCMHIYHMECIDEWLMRSFTCPSCMEPVDAALLSSYETN
ncbi:RING finger protein 11a isoform X1 [Carcharodon carcharias]|uniref:RING finger protein 11a isoform X1 n=1 Tax=Carcharodon carcharias TaxID=13397 RepID=UPI001B7DAA33|nr:RING finger protein 11a isoform X1 [Carcharodon carcharias]